MIAGPLAHYRMARNLAGGEVLLLLISALSVETQAVRVAVTPMMLEDRQRQRQRQRQ